jgi:hypothetical protein
MDKGFDAFLSVWNEITQNQAWLDEDSFQRNLEALNNLMIAIRVTMAFESGLKPKGHSRES